MTTLGSCRLGYNQFMGTVTHNLRLLVLSAMGAAAWLHCLVCPRRYLALLPSHTRPNLFAGD